MAGYSLIAVPAPSSAPVGPLVRREHRYERKRGEQRGNGVVPVEEYGPHQHRREDDRHEPQRAQLEPANDPGRADHEADATARHQELEDEHVVRVPDQRGQRKDRDRAGRVLDEEIVVRDLPVQNELSPIARVRADVARVRVAEKTAVGHGAGDDEETRRNDGQPIGRPGSIRPLHSGLPYVSS